MEELIFKSKDDCIVCKYNHNHGKNGQFSSSGGSGGGGSSSGGGNGKMLNTKQIDGLSTSQLKNELRKRATEYYKTPEMRKLIGGRKAEDVVDSLLAGASKASMRKDLKSISRKMKR
ncbi:MAG: hypothetical protein VB031_02230 [Eubacteriaceae bacterium]|nr:hypothetical protein [Eubacteriaceae bacterium]